jgi:hypothetical protein
MKKATTTVRIAWGRRSEGRFVEIPAAASKTPGLVVHRVVLAIDPVRYGTGRAAGWQVTHAASGFRIVTLKARAQALDFCERVLSFDWTQDADSILASDVARQPAGQALVAVAGRG